MSLLVIIASLALAPDNRAQDRNAIKATIYRQIDTYEKHMMRKDMDAVRSTFTPDFTFCALNGLPAGLEATMRATKQLFDSCRSLTMTDRIVKFDVMSRTVVRLRSENVLAAQVQGPSGRSAELRSESLTEDWWVLTGAGWKLRSVTAITSQTTLDGLPYRG
jgi:hypothetical protein